MSNRKNKIRTVIFFIGIFLLLIFATCVVTKSIIVRVIFALIYAYCLFFAGVDDYYWNQMISCLPKDPEELISSINLVKYHFYASERNVMICFDLIYFLLIYQARNDLYTMFLTILITIMMCTLTINFSVKASTYASNIYENSDEV